jgi:hypothetical protein
MEDNNIPYIPTTIDKVQLEKLRSHIDERFNAFDKNGKLDLDRCQLNIAYSIGKYYTTYNGLLFSEKHKLAEIECSLASIKAETYHNIKMSGAKYDVSSKGMDLLLDGSEAVRKKQEECDKQKAYISFLENTVKQISFYANGVKIMLQREELKARYGEL